MVYECSMNAIYSMHNFFLQRLVIVFVARTVGSYFYQPLKKAADENGYLMRKVTLCGKCSSVYCIDLDYMDVDIVVHAISYGTEWRFRRTFLPWSGRERIDLDLGTIKAFGTIQWFTLVT